MKKNSTNPFIRKIIYIALIGGLLIPLSMISRPEVTDRDGQIVDEGGRLSQMRRNEKLAQASISEIDPTSEAMKLASMGLRGVAVNILWMQALEHQKNEDYDKLAATLQTLTKVQPNFVKVWEFQGHNLAFNVSMEFDDYEYRYEWVKKGLGFLKGGIAYNKNDHRMTDNMGFFTGIKFGKSDEKLPFRRIFRKDNEFHESMADYIAPDSYDAREYGPDSYRMAWHWYDMSLDMVDNGADQFKNDLMLRMYRPSMTRQQAMILNDEFRASEITREIWEDADDEWTKYGGTELRNAQGVMYTMERMDQYERRTADLRQKLDKLAAPGARRKEQMATWKALKMNPDQFGMIEAPIEELVDEQRRQRANFFKVLNDPTRSFDAQIAESAPDEDKLEAKRIAREITNLLGQMTSISKDGSVINYSFWKSRNAAEATDAMVRARQAMYDAFQMRRKSIFEDEYIYDYKTGEKQVSRAGAATLFEEAFEKWDEVLQQHDELVDSPVMDELVTAMKQYWQIMIFSGKQWPYDFSLQWLVDRRARTGEGDGLPTSFELEMRRKDEEETASDEDEQDSDDDGDSAEADSSSVEQDEAGSAKDEESTDIQTESNPVNDSSSEEESVEKSSEESVDSKEETAAPKKENEGSGAGEVDSSVSL